MTNHCVRRNGNAHGFVKARLQWPGSQTEARMICEGFAPAASNFVNYGGSVSWVIDVTGPTTVEAWYTAAYTDIYSWVNDSNGVPRPIAFRIQ